MKTALAWKNLTHSWSKCALAAAGVGFAVVLMFMQIGFRGALIDNNVRLMTMVDQDVGNLMVRSRARYNMSTEQRFPRHLLEQAASSDKRISGFSTISLERGTAKVKVAGRVAKPIRVVAMELGQPDFIADKELYAALAEADRRDSALVDRLSKNFYGFATDQTLLSEQTIELNQTHLPVVGYFELGTDFGNDGTLLMSQRMHGRYFPWRNWGGNPNDLVDMGFLHANVPAAELGQLAKQIQALAPDEIIVQPTAEFEQKEKDFWAKQTPVGKIFLIGTAMGLLVGAIICYQIQFTDITEHMPEFATLKAMGYSPLYFWSLILWQSFYLACLGFIPGVLVSRGLYYGLYLASGLIMEMSPMRIALVWVLTLGMCAISGAIALRKLFGADPASLF